ncbi:MAG TPA: hypothetical protein VI452_17900 [Marmoricola sp.]
MTNLPGYDLPEGRPTSGPFSGTLVPLSIGLLLFISISALPRAGRPAPAGSSG